MTFFGVDEIRTVSSVPSLCFIADAAERRVDPNE